MRVKVVEGDLLDQQVDVIVNAWNRNIIPWWLLLPQGVSGAIKKRGGFQPFMELGWRPLPLGHARVTGAGRLPYTAIVHVAGINMLWRASKRSIQDCVRHAMAAAERLDVESIAFPVIGAGSGSFNQAEAERLMLETFETLDSPLAVTLVKFKPTAARRID